MLRPIVRSSVRPLVRSMLRFGGFSFIPSALFADGSQGAFYDPSDFSTLFQNSAGTTPVTAVEQPVRLMLDRSGRGNNATAPNDASRPVLRARYNLLTFSEQFDNAAWQKNDGSSVTANAVVAPDGTTTADQIDLSASQLSRVQQPLTAQPNGSYTFTVWLRVASGLLSIRLGTAVDIDAITVTATWQRFTVTKTVTGVDQPNLTIRNEAGGGAKTLYAWGGQILTAADQAATGGAYQRVGAATSYDTSNPVWRPYLAFDGSDDTMTIASSIHDVFQNVGGGTMWAGYMGAVTDKSLLTFTGGAGTARAIMLVDRTVGRRLDADSIVSASDAGFTANSIYVGTTINDWSGGNLIRRRNGAQVASSAYAAAGNTSNTASTVARIGADGAGTGSFLNGRIYSLIVLGRTASASEIASTETWVNGKTGAF